jgi:hypothetical protein
MALEINRLPKGEHVMGETFIITERLCRTEDGRIVPEDHPDSRWLYAVPGDEITLQEAERHGLVAAAESGESRGDEGASEDAESEGASEKDAESDGSSRSDADASETPKTRVSQSAKTKTAQSAKE